MNKEIKITPPEGYEIDKKNSTFEKIVFKEIEQKLPMRWEELDEIRGYFIGNYSEIACHKGCIDDINKNIFPTLEEAEAALALAQLCQLRDAWNGNWKADFKKIDLKYTIFCEEDKLCTSTTYQINYPMAFKTVELRDKFLETFKDLLEIAKPFL